MRRLVIMLGTIVASTAATAAEITVTLFIKNMFCAACPITVREAVSKVPGVKSVTVDFRKKVAIVVFDDAVTTVEKLAEASRNSGFPASRKE